MHFIEELSSGVLCSKLQSLGQGTMSFGMEHIEKENISKSDAEDVNTVEEGFNQNITVVSL